MAKGPAKKIKSMTKNEILTSIAQSTNLQKRDVQSVLDSLVGLIEKSIAKKDGVFTLPGLLKIRNVLKKKQEARQGVNPKTLEPMTIPAKPATNVVRVTPLKGLKEMVGKKK